MGVTLYLDGAFAGLAGGLKIQNVLGGELNPAGQKLVHVDWPGSTGAISNDAANTGMNNAYDAIIANLGLMTAADPGIVAGHSGGAQCLGKLLRERGTELFAALQAAGKTYTAIRFVLLGFPESKYTGASYLWPSTNPAVYPGDPANGGLAHTAGCPTPSQYHGGYGVGYGLPVTCPWRVDVVANQYDGWAHAPTTPSHTQLNKLYDTLLFVIVRKVWDNGLFSYLKSSTGPHGRYDVPGAKGLTSSDAYSYTDPSNTNVKYWIIRTYPFPGFDKMANIRFLARNLDMKNRTSIDGAYVESSSRGQQVSIPAPDYTAVSTWFPLS